MDTKPFSFFVQQSLPDCAGTSKVLQRITAFAQDRPTPTSERMAVPVLAVGRFNLAELCCVLTNFQAKLLAHTPSDLYLFSQNAHLVEDLQAHNCSLDYSGMLAPGLGDSWHSPVHARDPKMWKAAFFPEAYRRMGHWRLTFQLDFAYRAGYPYVLQLDLDSFFPEPVKLNLVEHMKARGGSFGARHIGLRDSAEVTVGLAELARYFIVTEDVQPTLLFEEDCLPNNISGLYSGNESHWLQAGGYSRRNLSGNFLIVSTAFWQQRLVQRFLHLVLATGGHFRFRWNEQATMAMLWQMFCQRDALVLFTDDFPFKHKDGSCLANSM